MTPVQKFTRPGSNALASSLSHKSLEFCSRFIDGGFKNWDRQRWAWFNAVHSASRQSSFEVGAQFNKSTPAPVFNLVTDKTDEIFG